MKENISVHQTFPISVRQMKVEMELLEKKIKVSESNPTADKQEATLLWMELLTLKERLKFFASVPYESPPEVNKAQKKVLRELFERLDGFVWSNRFGWVGQSKTPTRQGINIFEISSSLYDGVYVDKVTEEKAESIAVKAINFTGFGCRGELTGSLGSLTLCESVNLSFNLITGSLPRTTKNLVALKNLDLSCNQLSGCIENRILEGCINLIYLNLACNKFSGNIPDCFEALSCLEKLDLSCNQFSGYLPTSISCLSRLQELKVYNNQLIGAIPDQYGGLVNLRVANLSQNQLTFGLNVFNSCARLERLLLHYNQLQDQILPSIGQLKKLKMLYLQNNRVCGSLPNELCALTKLQFLNLSNNSLRGCLPENIGQLSSLQSLLLHHNNIIGPVPLSIKELQSLRDFFIFRPYPAEFSTPTRKFSKRYFERVYIFGPSAGINSMHWSYQTVYGREKLPTDEQSVTLFSGKL
ncbi:hypothetical protein EON65_28275 [archaeon]|nr:MAG: hypothetical protein EON65_28275 [archaeon]